MTTSLAIKPLFADSKIPLRASAAAAGADLYAHNGLCTLAPGTHAMIGTGIAISIPANHVGLVCPRSGLAAKHGLTVLNAPGIIDADYTGEIKVLLINLGQSPVIIEKDMRIAQLVITPFTAFTPITVETLDPTARGSGGFGHTGMF